MKVAIIGLGIIGAQWAKHLHEDNALVACWNRSAKPEFPKFDSDLLTIVDKAEILHICLADPAAVQSILDKICPNLKSTHSIIQSSTIDPSSAQKFKVQVQKTGAKYLEAPFTGSLPAAEKRELIFYAGGEKELLTALEPYLAKLSKKIFHIGSEGQAATLKLVMNLQIASAMEALAEAITISRSAQISDEIFFEAFRVNVSFSGVAALKEPKLKAKDFSTQFSVKHLAKDLGLLHKENKCTGTVFLDVLQNIFARAKDLGLSDEDFSSLVKLTKAA